MFFQSLALRNNTQVVLPENGLTVRAGGGGGGVTENGSSAATGGPGAAGCIIVWEYGP